MWRYKINRKKPIRKSIPSPKIWKKFRELILRKQKARVHWKNSIMTHMNLSAMKTGRKPSPNGRLSICRKDMMKHRHIMYFI